jgi:TRAP transporter TAXI family solute receptor
MPFRKLIIGAALALIGALPFGADAQETKFFRIGTGGTAGTYFPVGGMIGNAISGNSGFGVPGLVGTAVATNGSLANINAIIGGTAESGLTQSDVAFWAYTGTGLFEGKPKVENIRLIANLYQESIHVVARKGAGIRGIADLKGKRVSLDEPGSGTLVDARIILAAYGLGEKDLKDGGLDAFFFVGGFPAGAISELTSTGTGIELLPIVGAEAAKILGQYKFFAADTVPADTYKGVPETKTLSVGAQWVTSAKADEKLIHDITKVLWSEDTRKVLDAGHVKGKAIRKETALAGGGIPLHPGAERFYREAGLLK